MDSMVIGIAGGTGSGKTTVTNKLKEYFGDDVSIIYHDSYYKRHDEMPFEERVKLNYDHPDAFDTGLMIQDLKKLRSGQAVHCPVYDYSIHNRIDQTLEILPAKVIIVEVNRSMPWIYGLRGCEINIQDVDMVVEGDNPAV